MNPPPGALLTHPATASSGADEAEVPSSGRVDSVKMYVSASHGMVVHASLRASEDLAGWPEPSPHATTPESAARLERATTPDPTPRLPEIEIDDELGL